MIDPRNLDTLLHPQFDPAALKTAAPVGKALAASPGAACGKIVFYRRGRQGMGCPGREGGPGPSGDLSRGHRGHEGRSGHPDRPRRYDLSRRRCGPRHGQVLRLRLRRHRHGRGEQAVRPWLARPIHEGDWLSLDGSTGNIYDGAMPTVDASVGGDFGRIMAWADKYRRLQVRTNADTPHDAAKARELGAQGIGLCRTEHMFFEGDRIAAIREMICSDTVEQREKALAKLLPMQQGDFEGIYEAMEGCPVTIRFLDPPLHEFVPTEEADIELLAKDMGKTVAEIKAIIASLHEFNPMMGHRGCRLAVTYPRDRRDADPCRDPGRHQRAEASPRVEHGSRDHDPPGGRGQGAEVCQERRGQDR